LTVPVLGYDVSPKGGSLVVNEGEAERVRAIFDMYLDYGSLMPVITSLGSRLAARYFRAVFGSMPAFDAAIS
jgi:hypothetical protein